MAYIAIKKIGGKKYAYRQESYRQGGKVKTRIVEYLGAVDGEGKTGFSRPKQSKPKPVLRVDAEEFGLNTTAFEAVQSSHKRSLQKVGVETPREAQVTIHAAKKDRVVQRKNGEYEVYFSRKTGKPNKQRLWKNYRFALAGNYLDEIQKNNPERFQEMRNKLCDNHRETKAMIYRSLSRAKTPTERLVLTLQLYVWNRLPCEVQKKRKPEDFGLVNFESFKDWRSQSQFILAEANKLGWSGLLEKNRKAKSKIKGKITRKSNQLKNFSFGKRVINKVSGKKRRILREIMDLERDQKVLEGFDEKVRILRGITPEG